jgi:phosphoribosylformimino-5-aminoimidazole carboxamide ribotide isomerase
MKILPVIDLLGGKVVHAVGGRRQDYQRIVSPLCADAEPLTVARAFRQLFALTELYVADLDAIAGEAPATGIVTELRADGFRLWVDAGVRDLREARALAEAGAGIVIGLETLPGPQALEEMVAEHGEQVILSLDLRDGKPLGRPEGWKRFDVQGIADEAIAMGVRRLLVLDLARVGTGGGTGTEERCAKLKMAHPHVEILAGGGVRGPADLLRLAGCGVSAVLVASALHDGRLTRADIESL